MLLLLVVVGQHLVGVGLDELGRVLMRQHRHLGLSRWRKLLRRIVELMRRWLLVCTWLRHGLHGGPCSGPLRMAWGVELLLMPVLPALLAALLLLLLSRGRGLLPRVCVSLVGLLLGSVQIGRSGLLLWGSLLLRRRLLELVGLSAVLPLGR